MRCLSIADAAAPTMTSAFAMARSDQKAREIVQQRGHCVIELPDAMEFDSAGLDPTPESWDSDMVEYATVIRHKRYRFMFYNGNNYGNDGIDLAVEE